MITRNSRAKRFAMAAAVAAVGASALVASPASAAAPPLPVPDTSDPGTLRMAGANRYGTAAVINEVGDDNSLGNVCAVTVVNGGDEQFPDAMTASALTVSTGRSILLTTVDALPAETVAALDRLEATDCSVSGIASTIVGGTDVVSQAVFEALDDYGSADRIAGSNRYATALAVAAKTDVGASFGNKSVIIAQGTNFPDALAAGVPAGMFGVPILLNDGDTLRDDNKQFINSMGVVDAYIVGGTSAVPQGVEDDLNAIGLDVERFAGSDRWETSTKVADFVASYWDSYGIPGVILANGYTPADALAIAPGGSIFGQPVLLVKPCEIPATVADWHVAHSDVLSTVSVVGGTTAVCDQVLADAKAAATATAPAIVSATLKVDVLDQRVLDVNDGTSQATLKTVVGSAADGVAANAWSVVFATDSNATPPTQVAVDAATHKITVTSRNYALLNVSEFVTVWNASDAGDLFTATAATGATTFAATPAATETTPAKVAVTVVTTFNRPIANPTPFAAGDILVMSRPGPAAATVLDLSGPFTTFPGAATPTDVSDDTTLKSVHNATDPADVPMLGNDELRIAAGAITAPGGALPTAATSIMTLTAAP